MHCRDVCLVVTPRDGQNQARVPDILMVLSGAGWKTSVALEAHAGHAMQLAAEATQKGCDLVIAYGGDGTVNQVINGVMKARREDQRVVVGVIPGGTVNLWAVETEVPSDPVLAALALVNSTVRSVDLACVEIQALTFPQRRRSIRLWPHTARQESQDVDTARHYFLLMAGMGFDASVIGQVNRSLKDRLGILAVGLTAIKQLPGHRPFHTQIHSGNNAALYWQGNALQVMVSNTRQQANNANSWEMAPGAYVDDGMLDTCVIMPGNALLTMRQVASLLIRRKPDAATARFLRSPSFSITVPLSTDIQIDGDVMKLENYLTPIERERFLHNKQREQGKATYRFSVLPQTLQMAVPSTSNNVIFKHANKNTPETAAYEGSL